MLRNLPRLLKSRVRRSHPSFERLEGRQLLASFVVSSVADSGPGTLRQALLDAHAGLVASTIDFAIGGSGIHTIALKSPLPQISTILTIDATTQPGYAGSPLVAIDGTNGGANAGLEFDNGSTGSAVRGLAIERFQSIGIVVDGPQVTIQSNDIGVDPSGTANAGNGVGIEIFDVNNSPLGSAELPGSMISANVIGNNGDGVDLFDAVNALVTGNFIGTDASGNATLGNSNDGVRVALGAFNTISNNTISNNGKLGIEDGGEGTTLQDNVQSNNGYLVANVTVTASTNTVTTTSGQVVDVTYTLTNTGPHSASDVGLYASTLAYRNNIDFTGAPSGVIELVGIETSQGTAMLNSFGTYPTQTANVKVGTLAPGASAGVTIALKVIGLGTDSLIVQTSTEQPSTIVAAATATTNFVSTGLTSLSVTALAPAAAKVGTPETFTFVVRNNDPLYNVDAQVTVDFGDNLPALTSRGVLVSQGAISGYPVSPTPTSYVGDLGVLAPGASAIVTAVAVPTQSGPIGANVFAYSTSATGYEPFNNLAFAQVSAVYVPTVKAVALVPTTGPITSILVAFTAPITLSQAQDVRNYALMTVGSKARIKIQSATYAGDPYRAVTLTLARPLPRTGAALKLVVGGPGTPGLSSTDGTKLVGGIYSTTIPRG